MLCCYLCRQGGEVGGLCRRGGGVGGLHHRGGGIGILRQQGGGVGVLFQRGRGVDVLCQRGGGVGLGGGGHDHSGVGLFDQEALLEPSLCGVPGGRCWSPYLATHHQTYFPL